MSNVKMRMRKYFLQYAFFITHCALILFLVNCDLKVKTENTALFKLFSVFFIGSSTVPMPAFNPSTGTHNTDQYVTLYNTISGATIYYTTDGSIPTANSTPYTGAILIEGNGTTKTVQSVAIKSGMTDSNRVVAKFDFILI